MSEDRFVEDLRARAEALTGVAVEPEQVWRGARRRRARLAGATGAVAVVAVGAVALGGAVLPRTGADQAVVADGTTLTATSPADASDWPAVTVADQYDLACGAPAPEIRGAPDAGTLHLEPAAVVYPEGAEAYPTDGFRPFDGLTLTQDDHWALDAGMVNGAPSVLHAGLDGMSPPSVYFVRDGVVVGWLMTPVAAIGGFYDEPVTWRPGDRLSSHGVGRIDSCDLTDGDRRLPAGEYDVYVTQRVKTVPVPAPVEYGAGPDDLVGEHFLTLAGGPYRVTLDEGTPPGDHWEDEWARGQKPGLEDVQLSFEGLMPLELGSPVPVQPAPIDMIEWLPDACPGSAEPGRWVSAYQPRWEEGQQAPYFWPTVRDGRVVRIDLFAMQTTEGVLVPDDLATAQAAYPGLRPLTRSVDTGLPVDTWVAEQDGAVMVFEVAANDEADLRGVVPASPGTITAITLVESLADYDRPSWETYRCD